MQLEKSIVRALKSIGMPTNITNILSDRDGVEPVAPYLIIQVVDEENIGLPRKSISHEEGDVKESLFQTKDFNITLTFHASTSGDTFDWVTYFYSGLLADVYDWAFTQEGLGLVEFSPLMYQSQPVDNKNYKRAIVSIKFRSEVMNGYAVNPMNRLELTGDLVDSLAGKFDEVVVDIPFNE